MHCPNCGARNSDADGSCAQCGRQLPTVQQPLPYYVRPEIPNYLVHSILLTVLCCLPFGIVAIVYAAQVNSKLQLGDIAGATEASNQAKRWCWIGFICGLVPLLLYGLFWIVFVGAAIFLG